MKLTTQQRRKRDGLCHGCGDHVEPRPDGSRPSECRGCARDRAAKRRAIFAAARAGAVVAAPPPVQDLTVEQLEAERARARSRLRSLTRAIRVARSKPAAEPARRAA